MSTEVALIARGLQELLDPDQIRQLVQELVSFENDGASSKTLVGNGARLEPKRVAVAKKCSCLCVCTPMNPALWSTLPQELVQLVFARLPLRKIKLVRTLSTKWDQMFTSEDPEFMRACSEAHPPIFAMVGIGSEEGQISVRLYDIQSNEWYTSLHPFPEDCRCVTMSAGEGGLVCIVSAATNMKEDPLVISVLNPLTGQYKVLSRHALSEVRPQMVQLVMDEDPKCYKVIVVGQKEQCVGGGTITVAEVYCSKTGVWSSAEAFPGLIFGLQYRWHKSHIETDDWPALLEEIFLGPCAYDCAGRQLVEFDVHNDLRKGLRVKDYALVKDRLFVLHQGRRWTDPFVVSEYQYQGRNCEPNWVELKVHKCKEFEFPSTVVTYYMKLYACKGFLLLKAENGKRGVYEHELSWVYDLSTTKWQKIPAFRSSYVGDDAMYELRWDAVP